MATIIDPQAVERDVVNTSISELALRLQELLGQKTAAYLAGIKDPKMVGRWAQGKNAPSENAQMRMRTALHASLLLGNAYDAATAKAWLWGSNSRLGYEAPAYVIRHAGDADDLRAVVPAAIAFVSDAG